MIAQMLQIVARLKVSRYSVIQTVKVHLIPPKVAPNHWKVFYRNQSNQKSVFTIILYLDWKGDHFVSQPPGLLLEFTTRMMKIQSALGPIQQELTIHLWQSTMENV